MTGPQLTTNFLRRYLPDFCYQTAFEILSFLEQIDEDISEDCVSTTLCWHVRQGNIFVRKIKTKEKVSRLKIGPKVEYMRNPLWKADKK